MLTLLPFLYSHRVALAWRFSNHSLLALRWHDRVFGRFRHSKLDHLFCRYVYLLASGRIPSDPCLAVYPNEPAEARNDEHAIRLHLFYSSGCERVQELPGHFLAYVAGLGKLGHELCLRSEERRVGKECRSRWSPYH